MSVLDLLAASSYYYSSTTTNGSDPAVGAAVGAFLTAYFIFFIVMYVVVGFLLYRIFTKANKPGWAGFVPIYNAWVLFEIGGKPGWWVLLSFIPFVGGIIVLVMSLLVSIEVAKRFGKSSAFGVIALWLFSLVGYIILAFDSSTYHDPNTAALPQNPSPIPPQNPPAAQAPPSAPFVQ